MFRNARSLFSGNYGPKTIISQWYRTHIKVVGRKRNNKYHNHIYIFTYFHIIDNRQYNYLNKCTNYLMILVDPMLSQRIGKTPVSVMSAV